MLLKTLQWNIGGGKIRLQRDDPTDTYAYCHEGLDYVIDRLSSFNADIITLQETHANKLTAQAEVIAKDLNVDCFINYIYDGSHLEIGQGLGEAIISKYPLKSSQFEFFYNPKYKGIGPRGEKWVSHNKGIAKSIVQIKNTNLLIQTLHVFPFHRFGIDPLGENAQLVKKDVESKLQSSTKVALTQGDFNINNSSLKDFLPELMENVKEVILNSPTTPKNKWYDHIIYKGLKHLKSEVISDNILTDHFPIYSEFEVR